MSSLARFFDLHMHTPLCGHAFGEPRAFVEAAAARGLGRIAFSCHMPLAGADFGGPRIRMDRKEFPRYLEQVEAAREHGAGMGVTVLTGIEGEVCPDPAVQEVIGAFLASHPFDFVLGSVHHQLRYFQRWFREIGCKDDDDIINAYFGCLRDGAASGLFHSMAHPDVIRLYGTLYAPFDPRRHESIIREAIAAAVENEVCWEVNTSGRLKGPGIEHPDPIIRRWGREMGLRLTLGSDAHLPESVGQHFPEVLEELAAEGFGAVHFYEKGVRQAVPLETSG
jgi:histidinol-phosphatase (PHP family)